MSRNYYRELRRFVAAGNVARQKEVLEEMLQRDPDNYFARGEKARLSKGEALLAAGPFKTYKAAVSSAILARLQLIPVQFPSADFGHASTGKLREKQKLIEGLCADAEWIGCKLPKSMKLYMHQLRRTLFRRWMRAHRLAIRCTLGAVLLLTALVLAVYFTRQHAQELARELDSALRQEQWQEVQTLRRKANSNAYSLVYPGINAVLFRADSWAEAKQQCHEKVRELIEPIRQGSRTVECLTLSERATIERTLLLLPKGLDDLTDIWKQLCLKEKERLQQRQDAEIARLRSSIPEHPAWTGDLRTDIPALQQTLKEAEALYAEYQDAVVVYHLPETELEHIQECLKSLRLCMEGLQDMQSKLGALSSAKTLVEYASALPKGYKDMDHPMAVAASYAGEHLPDERRLQALMANPGQLLPQDFVEEARHSFLEGGPTFTAANPASAEQVEFLQDLFTTRTLRTHLFELKTRDGRYAYASQRPTLSKGNDWITFSRDGIDPGYRVDGDLTETWSTTGLDIREVDARPLIAAAGLQSRIFFAKVNIIKALTTVLQTEAKACPALARAYVYDCLLQVIRMHKKGKRLGVQFSPSLQEDMKSFHDAKLDAAINLKPGCWLALSDYDQRAEEVFQRWFDEHRGHDYAREIARNYGPIARVHPRYAGFATFDGALHLHMEIPEGTELWYTGQDGTIRHDQPPADGKVWEKAMPFSPVFVLEKDKGDK